MNYIIIFIYWLIFRSKKLLILFLPLSLFGQYPILNDFNTTTIDGWFTSGQPNTGWHTPSSICTNISGNYLDDNNYIFTSPILDHTSCDSISVVFSVSFNIRNGDTFYFRFFSGVWYSVPIPGSGVWGVNLPNTTNQISFWLNTFANGGLNMKYCHINYTIIDCYTNVLPVEFLNAEIKCNELSWETQSETNSSHFLIEYSLNAKDWRDYLIVDSKGSDYIGYRYILGINGKGYYRITQYDFNDANKVLYIGYNNCITEPITYQVYSIDGKYLGGEIPNIRGVYVIRNGNFTNLIIK